jgi:hypothetical protein
VVKKEDEAVTMKHAYNRQSERGSSIAELAVVALLFFMMIFGIIEFGRLLYTHNALADATRRGARFAVLHPGITDADKLAVKREVVYGSKATFDEDGMTASSPLINGLTVDMVEVTFEGEDLDGDPDTPPTSFGSNLGSATVKIVGYSFNLGIPVIGRALSMPDYVTTLSAECAGEIPGDIDDPEPTPEPEPTVEPTPVP